MVSAAKLRKTEHTWYHTRPYYEQIRHMIMRLVFAGKEGEELEIEHPYLKTTKNGVTCLVIISSDRGLCGSFNTNIIHRAEDFLRRRRGENIVLYCIGRRAYSHFHRYNYRIIGSVLHLAANIDYETIDTITDALEKSFLEGAVTETHFLYSRFISRGHQYPLVEQILPITTKNITEPETMEAFGEAEESIIEPDLASLVGSLLPTYIRAKIRIRLLEAFTSEHSARMITMTNATRNCIELEQQLTLKMNKARQSAITKELLDIVGGAETFR